MDDLDQQPGKPNYGDPTFATLLIDIINTKPSQANMAAVEEKGTMYMAPTMVAMCSNKALTPTSLKVFVNESAAVLRRFNFYVEMRVRRAWANANGGLRKDVEVTDDSWEFVVSTFAPGPDFDRTQPDDTIYAECVRFTSRVKFLSWMRTEYQAHRKLALARAQQANESLSEKCPACSLPAKLHLPGSSGPLRERLAAPLAAGSNACGLGRWRKCDRRGRFHRLTQHV
jgi:hypothetical protein